MRVVSGSSERRYLPTGNCFAQATATIRATASRATSGKSLVATPIATHSDQQTQVRETKSEIETETES